MTKAAAIVSGEHSIDLQTVILQSHVTWHCHRIWVPTYLHDYGTQSICHHVRCALSGSALSSAATAHLLQDGSQRPGALTAARVRHDAEAAHVVAATHNAQEGAACTGRPAGKMPSHIRTRWAPFYAGCLAFVSEQGLSIDPNRCFCMQHLSAADLRGVMSAYVSSRLSCTFIAPPARFPLARFPWTKTELISRCTAMVKQE